MTDTFDDALINFSTMKGEDIRAELALDPVYMTQLAVFVALYGQQAGENAMCLCALAWQKGSLAFATAATK